MEKPKKLFKYVVKDRVDIFLNGMIRFTQPRALNDPFELLPLIETLLPEDKIAEALEPNFEFLDEALREQYKQQPENIRNSISEDEIVELVRGNPEILKRFYREFEPQLRTTLVAMLPDVKGMMKDMMAKNIGILSLSQEIDNVLLWSHYSNSHKGFAIEFNGHHEFFERKRGPKDEFYHLRKVDYINKTSKGKSLFNINSDELLCTKDLQWQYENEWRMLAPLDDAKKVIDFDEEQVYLFELPLDSITGVILGASMTKTDAEMVRQAMDDGGLSDIELRKAIIDIENHKIVVDSAPNGY